MKPLTMRQKLRLLYRTVLACASLILLAAPLCAQSPSVQVNWAPNPSNPAGISYNVYRALSPSPTCPATGLTFSKLNTTLIAATSFLDTVVVRGNTYCYRVTAASATLESAPSGVAPAAIPLGAPGTPTITVNIALSIQLNGEEVLAAAKSIPVGILLKGEGQ